MGRSVIAAVHIKGEAKKGKEGGKFYLLFPDSHNVHRASGVEKNGDWMVVGRCWGVVQWSGAGFQGLHEVKGRGGNVGFVADLVVVLAEHKELGDGCLLHELVDLVAADDEEGGCPGIGICSGCSKH